jgi:undecaprenyl-diphosphatase
MKPFWLVVAVAVLAYVVVRRRQHGPLALGGGLAAAAALALYGAGVVELPNVEHLIEDLGAALGPYTYVLVGVLAFLETGAFVGLLAPGETTIIVGGVVAGQGEISIVALIALVWVCAVAGDLTSFVLGRRLGRDFMLRHGPRVKITPERLIQVERFFDRHGGKAVFLGRFVGIIRAVAPFIAGSSGMSLRRFLPYDILGAGLWGATFALLGYVFWRSFDRVAEYAGRGAFALGTVIVVVGGTVVAVRWLRVEDNRARAHAWLHRHAERPRLRPVARVVRPVVWRGLVPAWSFASGPLRFAGGRLTPGDLGLELTTLVAILAVACFTFFALDHATGAGPTGTDLDAGDLAAEVRTAEVVDLAKMLTGFGAFPLVATATLVVMAVLVWRRRVIAAIALGAGLTLTFVLVQVTKAAVDRPRPAGGLVETEGASFPSGHAAYGVVWVALAVALGRVVPWLAGRAAVLVVAVALAAVAGLTRVELRAHYLTDVVAGWATGAAAFAVCGLAALVVAHLRHNGRSS